MVLLPPIVVEIQHTREFVQYVLENHAPPSTLIVCSSKADFLETLQSSDQKGADFARAQYAKEEQQQVREGLVNRPVNYFAPTLRMLSTSQTVKLAFCPDISHLRAYLACFATDNSSGSLTDDGSNGALRTPGAVPILAILNPIELHRPTSAFSAQGVNRTLSIAVEAAYRNGRKLVLAETACEVWAEELSLLNVTNKRLGELAVGRSVTAKAVAGRWCTFETHVPFEA